MNNKIHHINVSKIIMENDTLISIRSDMKELLDASVLDSSVIYIRYIENTLEVSVYVNARNKRYIFNIHNYIKMGITKKDLKIYLNVHKRNYKINKLINI